MISAPYALANHGVDVFLGYTRWNMVEKLDNVCLNKVCQVLSDGDFGGRQDIFLMPV
jgi:hypothetical protein